MGVSDEYKAQFFDEHMPNYECKKPDCFFCEKMGLKQAEINPYLDRPIKKITKKFDTVANTIRVNWNRKGSIKVSRYY